MIYRIKHKLTRNQQVILGASIIDLDTEGVAEVPKDVYENVTGLKNWEQLDPEEGEGKFTAADATKGDTEVAASGIATVNVITVTVEELEKLNLRVAELEGQVSELSDEKEKLIKEVEELEREKFHLETLVGQGKSLEDVLPKDNGIKRTRKDKK